MEKDELLRRIEEANQEGQHTLYFIGEGLKKLPPEIGRLTSLAELDVSSNELKELPPEIGQLTNLRVFDLRNNQLTELPPEIGRLNNLTELYLLYNNLTELAPEIGQLTKLLRLDLESNQLESLPPEIGQLTNLRVLDLRNNQLTELPPEIKRLTSLKELYLQLNPLSIPPEITDKSDEPDAIINYYFRHRAGRRRRLNEAKMLVVGQGSVGKTSLVRCLTEGKFDPHENKTEGIDIRRWEVEVDGQPVRLNVWDFGGQEIMHATHQFFLTKRSLYVLVLDSRVGEEENRLEYWLKIIQSFGKESPVIVVGNKADQQGLDLDRRGLQTKYPNIKAFVETSCQSKTGIEELRAAIVREVGALEHVHDELLANWFAVKERLEQLKEDYIPFHEYVRLCREEQVSDETSQNTLIGFLHDLGLVLNFRDDPRLEETNILNPEWVTNGVYKILNSHVLFQSKGMLERQWLGQILDPRKYPKDKHLFIMDMMRKFELCFDFEGERDERFLIPDLLTKEEPFTGDWGGALAFQYHYNVLPSSIISRFIVRMHKDIYKNTLWRTGVVLKSYGNQALVKADIEDRKIFVWVSGPENYRRMFLEAIRSHLDSIHGTIPGIIADEKVPLPTHPEIAVDYKHLLRLEAKGIPDWIPEGLEETVNVKQLLDGIETELSRWERQEARDRERRMERPPRPRPPQGPNTSGAVEVKDGELSEELTKIKKRLDEKSERYAKHRLWLFFGLLVAVSLTLAVLTYTLGWGAVEPWAYFVGVVPTVLAYAYFALTLHEASPRAIYEHLVERRRLKNYSDAGFDPDRYEKLTGRAGE